jgi:hypothetical protein
MVGSILELQLHEHFQENSLFVDPVKHFFPGSYCLHSSLTSEDHVVRSKAFAATYGCCMHTCFSISRAQTRLSRATEHLGSGELG